MSAFSGCQNIPSRRIILNDASQLPHDYSSTPGGTLYSTTPGGTRIVYERNFLMNLRNSPIARTPPKNYNNFPDNMMKGSPTGKANGSLIQSPTKREPSIEEAQEQFQMDM